MPWRPRSSSFNEQDNARAKAEEEEGERGGEEPEEEGQEKEQEEEPEGEESEEQEEGEEEESMEGDEEVDEEVDEQFLYGTKECEAWRKENGVDNASEFLKLFRSFQQASAYAGPDIARAWQQFRKWAPEQDDEDESWGNWSGNGKGR